MKISAVILTKNEEKNIRECLKSLKFCDEIIIVDDFSEDETVEIAKNYDSRFKIYERRLNGDFAAQRNYALEKCSKDWALFIDADERVSKALALEISKLKTQNSNLVGYDVRRQDILWGRKMKHGEFGQIKLLRLARKDAGKWKRQVHEVWEVKGKIGQLKNPIIHNPHQTLREFISDINWQSSLHAEAILKEGKRASVGKIVLFPLAHFARNWKFRLGFLDGTEGFVAALIMSFHSFLAWSKLWIRQREK